MLRANPVTPVTSDEGYGYLVFSDGVYRNGGWGTGKRGTRYEGKGNRGTTEYLVFMTGYTKTGYGITVNRVRGTGLKVTRGVRGT